MSGPLEGTRVVEIAGLGPAPFCGMVLADLGAEVIRVDRATLVTGGHTSATRNDVHNRGKKSIGVNLKSDSGVEVVLRLVRASDALIEGFRPGVTERLGIGPAQCLAVNPTLVYGRMTGWGQDGPMASTAGHDIDYIALSGALHAIGSPGEPVVPLNLVGDFGGGGMLLAVGVLAALLHSRATGQGQVVDAAMVDGSALLTASHHGFMAEGVWDGARRRANFLDGAAPFYRVYATSDGGHVAVGALEPQFFAELLDKLDLDTSNLPAQTDRAGWPAMTEVLAERFAQRTRDEWSRVFVESDSCVVPVLSFEEAHDHPHNMERKVFLEVDGVVQPGPAPRFSETPGDISRGPVAPGEDTDVLMAGLGYSPEELGKLREAGSIA